MVLNAAKKKKLKKDCQGLNISDLYWDPNENLPQDKGAGLGEPNSLPTLSKVISTAADKGIPSLNWKALTQVDIARILRENDYFNEKEKLDVLKSINIHLGSKQGIEKSTKNYFL